MHSCVLLVVKRNHAYSGDILFLKLFAMNRWNFSKVILIGWLTPLVMSLYLPTFPALSSDFGVSLHSVQLTLTLFFVGNFLSQMFSGPLVDRHGYMRVLNVGIALCVLGSLLSAMATDFSLVLFGRLLQGMGAGSIQVGNMVQFRVLCPKEDLAKYASFLGVTNVAARSIIPVFGGYILHYLGWQACFFTVALLASSMWIWHWATLPENLPSILDSMPIQKVVSPWLSLLSETRFMGIIALSACTYASACAWTTASPILLRVNLGIGAIPYGWWMSLTASIYVLGAFLNGALVKKVGEHKMLQMGLMLFVFFGAVLIGFWHFLGQSKLSLIMPISGIMLGIAFVFPNVYALAFKDMPQSKVGTGSAIYGMLRILAACLSSAFIAWAPKENQSSLLLVVGFSMCMIAWLYLKYARGSRALPKNSGNT